jgi:predicted amidophosphoribosyltransferase
VTWLAELTALIAPPTCAACRAPLARAGAPVCPGCLQELPWLPRAVCRRCALPHHGGRACPGWGSGLDSAWAPLAYDGAARGLVHALKFAGALPLASFMAAQVAANAPPWATDGCVAVVAVPPSRGRLRARGYDPAALLAAGVAERLGLPVVRGLRRTGAAPHQLGAGRVARRAAGRVTVEAAGGAPAALLLVDDVHTTGATLAACAGALRAGGATRVRAVAYARTLG